MAALTLSIPQRVWNWKLAPSTSVGFALNSATQRLKEVEIDTASLDTQVILAHVLGVDRAWLFAHHEVALTPQQAERFTDLIARRVRQEPVAYLVGRREFYGLDLLVDRRVLIPRPETELLVDEVLTEIDLHPNPQVRIADVGTGSGAIALAIVANNERARVYAIDISRGALAVARTNARRFDGRRQVTLLRGDLLDPLPEKVDVIVANLPYISSTDYQRLDSTVRDFEPRLALESGDDGLDAISRLLRRAPNQMNADGKLYLEIGHGQASAVRQLASNLLPQARNIAIHHDYAQRERMVAIAM